MGKNTTKQPKREPEPGRPRRQRDTHGDDSGLELLGTINEETGELEPITPDEWRKLQRRPGD